ncbi:hypothetical protein GTW43_36705 [Streptomyces sp. SID5785]|uniref:hypothetical protein n=1 Tax=Streptomyces sp. SID5785 TaxID=2690309 RepID=UPI0013619D40|nr:hypothetical protein [Streptomyces sp. SID5785]MZD10579.1 hypothetical protein [Streptomyces sp. SID5785]
MGAWRRMSAAVALVAAAVAAGVACDPVDGALNPSTVSVTTDLTATKELERQHADVAWLSCSGTYRGSTGTGNGGATPSRSGATPDEVRVDCHGATQDGKDITVNGRVHGVVSGACVRGDLRAKIGGKEWFRLAVLGNCAAASTTSPPPAGSPPPSRPAHPAPGATRTVTETATETVTVRPPAPEPTCSCFQGK